MARCIGCLLWLAAGVLVWNLDRSVGAGEIDESRSPVELGRQIFEHNFGRPESWKGSSPLGNRGDGLGPQFNDVSCIACHKQGGVGGAGPASKNVRVLSVVPAKGLSRGQLETVVRQASAMHAELSATQTSAPLHHFRLPQPEDRQSYEAYLTGIFDQLELEAGQTGPKRKVIGNAVFEITERNTTALWGSGAIDEFRRQGGGELRRRFIEEQNQRFSWLSGRVPRDAQQRESWFGWRGQMASLHEFNLGACATELGLTVPGIAQHHSTVDGIGETAHRLDLTEEQSLELTRFVASLPPPRQVPPNDAPAAERVAIGEQVFNNCQCNACHCRDLGWLTGIYSDLALHDMGPQLCDASMAIAEIEPGETIPQGFKQSSPGFYYSPPVDLFSKPPKVKPTNCECEWRTPPLWGCADSAPYLHDGRAATLDAAILWHDGESAASRQAYELLTPSERSLLISFLETLRAPQPSSRALAEPTLATVEQPVRSILPDAPSNATADGRPEGPSGDVEAERGNPADNGADSQAVLLPDPVFVAVDPDVIAPLHELLTGLKPTATNSGRAHALRQELDLNLPGTGAADFALALFQKRSLQHSAAMSTFSTLAHRGGVYAARARIALIVDQLRERKPGPALASLEGISRDLNADSTLTSRDIAELAESLGVILAWLRGPAGVDAARYEIDAVLTRVRAALPADSVPFFEAGMARVESQVVNLEAERSALVALESAQQQNQATTLAERRDDLDQQRNDLENSQQAANVSLDQQLARIDPLLLEMEKQYAERDGVEQRLAAQAAPLKFRADSILLQLSQITPSVATRQVERSLRTELSGLDEQLSIFNRQRAENQTQARLVVLNAQKLAAERSAAVAEYTRLTGRAVQQLESLTKWQDRFEKQSEQLGETSADQSPRVKRIDRSIKNLATYFRFDAEAEAQWMLARYRAKD